MCVCVHAPFLTSYKIRTPTLRYIHSPAHSNNNDISALFRHIDVHIHDGGGARSRLRSATLMQVRLPVARRDPFLFNFFLPRFLSAPCVVPGFSFHYPHPPGRPVPPFRASDCDQQLRF